MTCDATNHLHVRPRWPMTSTVSVVPAPRSKSRRGCLAALRWAIMVVVVVVAHPASAQTLPEPANPEARQLLIEGNEAYDSGKSMTDQALRLRDLREAIRLYRAGAALETANFYTFMWNLGLASRAAADYDEAIKFFQHFIDRAPKQYAQHRAAAANNIAEMRTIMATLDRERTGGSTPPAPTPRLSSSPPRHRSPWFRDRLTLGLGVAGAAGTVVGAFLGWRAASLYRDADSEPAETKKGDLRGDAQASAIAGSVLGGVGVALITVTVIRVSTQGSIESRSPVQVTLGPSWVGLQGSF